MFASPFDDDYICMPAWRKAIDEARLTELNLSRAPGNKLKKLPESEKATAKGISARVGKARRGQINVPQ